MTKFKTHSVAIRIGREMALDYGLARPTPEEAAERARVAAELEVERRASWKTYDAAREALSAIDDPLARAVLDLHSSKTVEAPACEGCDASGYEVDDTEWPCRTVEVVAAHYGIALPKSWHLWRRPTNESEADE